MPYLGSPTAPFYDGFDSMLYTVYMYRKKTPTKCVRLSTPSQGMMG